MTDEQIQNMILDIVGEVDYDIYKGMYVKETAENPELVDDNIAALVMIAKRHLSFEE